MGLGSLGVVFVVIVVAGLRAERDNRRSTDRALSLSGTALRRAGGAARPPAQPTLFSRGDRSLIYTASCPIHEPTGDPNSRGLSLAWDMDTGMAHCLWCGWGGRLSRPLSGRIHLRFFPKLFSLVVSA